VEKDRKFGALVGGILTLIGALLSIWKGRMVAGLVLGVPGAVLLVLAAAAPSLLAAPHRAWLRFSHLLGTINGLVFLSIIFFLILTPLGFVLRLFGRDELRRRGPVRSSGWEPYPERNRDPKHFERIF